MWFFGLFRAKMNTIGIQNPKLIVINDFQQFLAHFEGFLAFFQISVVKPELLLIKLKVQKMSLFGQKTDLKKMSKVIFAPKSKLWEEIESKWPLNGFL